MNKDEDYRKCPDGGKCHHNCEKDECFRVRFCAPFTMYGEDWSEEDKNKYGKKEAED